MTMPVAMLMCPVRRACPRGGPCGDGAPRPCVAEAAKELARRTVSSATVPLVVEKVFGAGESSRRRTGGMGEGAGGRRARRRRRWSCGERGSWRQVVDDGGCGRGWAGRGGDGSPKVYWSSSSCSTQPSGLDRRLDPAAVGVREGDAGVGQVGQRARGDVHDGPGWPGVPVEVLISRREALKDARLRSGRPHRKF